MADAENFEPLKIRATEQKLKDKNKIAIERQISNCDLRIDRDMCTFVIMYMYIPEYTLIFENFKGGGAPPTPPLNPPVGTDPELPIFL